nr:MAG TPA: hypothetical protein [Caudoviricetes sp.]
MDHFKRDLHLYFCDLESRKEPYSNGGNSTFRKPPFFIDIGG